MFNPHPARNAGLTTQCLRTQEFEWACYNLAGRASVSLRTGTFFHFKSPLVPGEMWHRNIHLDISNTEQNTEPRNELGMERCIV